MIKSINTLKKILIKLGDAPKNYYISVIRAITPS
jgi:hypothetical protein